VIDNAVLALVAVVGMVVGEPMPRDLPQTAPPCAAVAAPVNPTGLMIEQVHAEPKVDQGHATLTVSGVIHNVVDHPVTSPPLRVSLLNTEGKRLAGQILTLDNVRIAPGEARHFTTSFVDPPYPTARLQVEFAPGAAEGAQ